MVECVMFFFHSEKLSLGTSVYMNVGAEFDQVRDKAEDFTCY